MFNLFFHKYSIFHKSSLWGSMVPAETLNLHVFYILLFFHFKFFLFSVSARKVHEPLPIRKKIYFFNHWVQNHCTLIVTYCIVTSNAEHVATLRAFVEYHQLESTKSILISSERLIVC